MKTRKSYNSIALHCKVLEGVIIIALRSLRLTYNFIILFYMEALYAMLVSAYHGEPLMHAQVTAYQYSLLCVCTMYSLAFVYRGLSHTAW